jgi:hypothetical protein
MRRLSQRLRRPSAGALLLLQLALMGAWTSHAAAALGGVPTAHVEAAGGTDGRVAHDHDTCAICQATATSALVPVPPTPGLTTDRVTVVRPPDPIPATPRATRSVGQPRAPPPATD